MQPGTDTACEDRRTCDRRRRRRHTFFDQRSGFDRRTPVQDLHGVAGTLQRTLLGLRDHPNTLFWVLVATNALNIADYGLTMNALANGFSEGNPVMGFLIQMSPIWAGVFKTAAVLLASLLVWQLKRYRKALLVALLMLAVFAGVFAWHLYGLAVMF